MNLTISRLFPSVAIDILWAIGIVCTLPNVYLLTWDTREFFIPYDIMFFHAGICLFLFISACSFCGAYLGEIIVERFIPLTGRIGLHVRQGLHVFASFCCLVCTVGAGRYLLLFGLNHIHTTPLMVLAIGYAILFAVSLGRTQIVH